MTIDNGGGIPQIESNENKRRMVKLREAVQTSDDNHYKESSSDSDIIGSSSDWDESSKQRFVALLPKYGHLWRSMLDQEGEEEDDDDEQERDEQKRERQLRRHRAGKKNNRNNIIVDSSDDSDQIINNEDDDGDNSSVSVRRRRSARVARDLTNRRNYCTNSSSSRRTHKCVNGCCLPESFLPAEILMTATPGNPSSKSNGDGEDKGDEEEGNQDEQEEKKDEDQGMVRRRPRPLWQAEYQQQPSDGTIDLVSSSESDLDEDDKEDSKIHEEKNTVPASDFAVGAIPDENSDAGEESISTSSSPFSRSLDSLSKRRTIGDDICSSKNGDSTRNSSSSEEAEWNDEYGLSSSDDNRSVDELAERINSIIILSSDEEDEESSYDGSGSSLSGTIESPPSPSKRQQPTYKNNNKQPVVPSQLLPAKKEKKQKKSPPLSKTAFRRCRDALVKETFSDFDRLAFGGRLVAAGVTVRWSNKLRTTAGITRLTRQRQATTQHPPHDYQKRRMAAVELSTKVIDSVDRLRSTLLHELCHAAAWVIDNNAKPPHGPCFKKWARIAMAAVRDVLVTVTHDYEIQYKYAWACTKPSCGVVVKRHSRSVDVNKQVCGRCMGKLVEIEVPTASTKFTKNLSDSSAVAKHTPRKKAPLSAYNRFVKERSAAVRLQLQSEREAAAGTNGLVKVTQPEVMKECARLWRLEKNKKTESKLKN